MALAFAPSSLLLAVTSYISTDVASVPLLWVVPLSIYLVTFVVAFSPSAVRARGAGAALHAAGGHRVDAALLIAQMDQPLSYVIPVHLGAFAIVALFCHGELAQDRPSPARLTEFFLWIALGGMLGGLFNALVAPVVFVGDRRVSAGACADVPAAAVRCADASGGSPGVRLAPRRRRRGRDRALPLASVLVNNRFGSQSRFLILGAARARA